MKVLMLSKVFPTYHKQAGKPTLFRERLEGGRKIHTIRANAKGYFKNGDLVSVRQWTGKPYRSKQEEIGTTRIHLEHIVLDTTHGFLECMVEGKRVDQWVVVANDGLWFRDFLDWFFPFGKDRIEGDILHFTDFRYNQ